MLGSLILYLKGMRIMMFQLSGFYYKGFQESEDSRHLGFGVLGIGPHSGNVRPR